MVFSRLTFLLLFLPLLLLFYFLSGNIRYRNGVLVLFSLVFYAWGEPVLVLLLAATTLVNYLCALGADKAQRPALRKLFLALGVGISLASLLYFKYAGFFADSLNALLPGVVTFTAPRLPIGISFYTFQILTYTVDVYRKKTPVQRSFAKLLLYVSCFPQLIAGPIVQYGDIAQSLSERETTLGDFSDGMRRFFLGLGKKVLLANICGAALEGCTLAGSGVSLSFGGAWLAGFLYTLQLYFDFSAYSDMAIGLGRVLGFHYKENFAYPYISQSPTEFWRRWHISLGSFFRDYVYIPLGGSRKGKGRTLLNLLIVWSLTGLWHGASWNFVLWGLYWFLLLALDKSLPESFKKAIPGVFRALFTFLLATAGWVLFYYTDLAKAGEHLLALIGLTGAGPAALWDSASTAVVKEYALFLPVAFVCAMPILPFLKKKLQTRPKLEKPVYFAGTALLTLLAVLSVLYLVGQSFNPFIYFRF